MSSRTPHDAAHSIWSFAIAGMLVAPAFLSLASVGIDLADEGFLWYGATRVAEGGVPHRDFQSYEPGRYYWIAAGASFLGPGLLALRASTAAFFAIGLACGLQVLGRAVAHPGWRIAAGAILMLWAFPRHKLFEPALAMAATWVAVRLIEQPNWRRHLQAGAFVGIALFFGRNHALYSGLALAALLLWAHWKRGGTSLPLSVRSFAAGGLIGSLPIFVMIAFVPGFAESFIEDLMAFIARGANLPLPFPWPWRVRLELGPVTLGLCFVLAPLVIAAGLWLAVRGDAGQKAVQVVVASSFVALPYAHHAAIRSDVFHLAQAIAPVLLTALALPVALGAGKIARFATWGAVALLSVIVGLTMNPLISLAQDRRLIEHRIGNDALRLPPLQARSLRYLEQAIGERVAPTEPILIVPFSPGLYPVLGRPAPIRSTYLLWPASEADQQEMIRFLDIGKVNWALVEDVPLGRNEDLRFSNSHPLVWQHLTSHYRRVRDARLSPRLYLMERRNADPAPGEG